MATSDFEIKNSVLMAYHGNGGDVAIPEGVREIDFYAFSGNAIEKIVNLIIPSSVKKIPELLCWEAPKLERVEIHAEIEKVPRQAFENCPQLYHITLPDGLKVIGENAFAQCPNLTNLALPKSLEHIEPGAFWACGQMTEIAFSDNLKTIGDAAFMQTGISSIHVPEGVTHIFGNAFDGCGRLSEVVFSEGLKMIDVNVFKDCKSLNCIALPSTVKEVWLEAFIGSNITKVENLIPLMFNGLKFKSYIAYDSIKDKEKLPWLFNDLDVVAAVYLTQKATKMFRVNSEKALRRSINATVESFVRILEENKAATKMYAKAAEFVMANRARLNSEHYTMLYNAAKEACAKNALTILGNKI